VVFKKLPDEDLGPQTHVQKTRKCLLCTEEFESEWIGERVCTKCKATSIWRSGAL
jgi:hypothetical protein